MWRFLRWIAFLLSAAVLGQAQTVQKPIVQFSLLGGIGRNFLSADVQRFEQIVGCGRYRNGGGWGPLATVQATYPWTATVGISLEVGYRSYSGVMENTGLYSYRPPGATEVRTAQITNVLEGTWQYIAIAPMVRYRFLSTSQQSWLTLATGLQFGFPLQATYVQRQRFDPDNPLVFIVDGKRLKERILAEGTVQSKQSVLIHHIVAVEHQLQLSRQWSLLQTLSVAIPWNSQSTETSWKAVQVGLQGGIAYTLLPPLPIQLPTPPPAPAPPVAIAPKPEAHLALAFGDDVHWNVGSELIATLPIVNAVFFERGSATIPQRYVQQMIPKQELDTITDAVRYHRYVLPVLASIAQENPEATFELIGATSGADDEPEGIALARRRAEAVADALERLGVPRQRLHLRWQLLPANPSNPDFPEGRAENRRVDIVVHNAPLLRYVRAQRFQELEGTLAVRSTVRNAALRSHPAVLHLLPPVDTMLQTREEQFATTIPFRWRFHSPPDRLSVAGTLTVPNSPAPLVVYDTAQIRLDTLPRIEVELRLDRFEAILRFDYNSSALSEANQQLLRQLVDLLPEGSTIIVYGSSDTLGTERRNRILAQQRAENVSQFLQSIAPGAYRIVAERYTGKKFDEQLPEGRFLNRSIRLRVVRQHP